MRRLLLPTLLGVFCLALLALPANAGWYDPHNPPPTPYIDINGDLNNNETGWETPAQSYNGDENLNQPILDPSEDMKTVNSNTVSDIAQILTVIRKVMFAVFISAAFR
jgi:hypothetical protein